MPLQFVGDQDPGYTKCFISADAYGSSELHPCERLQEHSQLHGNCPKGLSYLVPRHLNVPGWPGFTAGVVYRNKHNAVGLMINYCPWCGVDIRPCQEVAKQ